VSTAISTYNAALEAIVNSVTATTDSAKVAQVNKALIDKVTYAYTAENEVEDPYIHTAYGGIVSGNAVCEGYAKSFKVIMDKLDIPCVLVSGEANVGTEDDPVWQAHMWNYVKLDVGSQGKQAWYALDVTWNDTTNVEQKYYLLGSLDMNLEHSANGVVSSVGYEFKYPALDAYNYGSDRDGFDYSFIKGDGTDNSEYIEISYNGKSSDALKEEGLYLAWRVDFGTDFWTTVEIGMVSDDGTVSKFNTGTRFDQIQFAVLNVAPNFAEDYYDSTQTSDFVATSAQIQNGVTNTYIAPPFASSTTPGVSGDLDPVPDEPYETTIVYDELLQRVENEEITVTVVKRDGTAWSGAKVEDVKWDGKSTLTFKFTPDGAYGAADQLIHVTGLVGVDSKQTPNNVSFRFTRKAVVCSKVYNDGRLWMSVYGSPVPVADQDLSEENYINQIPTNQRSQLMLVASKPDDTQSSEMIDEATEALGGDSSAIMASTTYSIDLVLCGCVQTVPDGSYMQVGFGFPDGYGPEDEGVTFKVYHYKQDADGNITGIEEVPCVITQYGLVATVQSFSPYAVVAVDSSKVTTTTKNIYASALGDGSISSDKNGGIVQLSEGDSITYTITPQAGYEIEAVLVNGEKREVTGNTLTLSYADLKDSNTVEAYFVATSVKEREQADGITNVFVARQAVSSKDLVDPAANTSSGVNNVLAIVIVVVLSVVVIAGLVTVLICTIQKNKRKEDDEEE
jgi:hypothetical protein